MAGKCCSLSEETVQDGVSTQQTSQHPDQANTGDRR